MQDSDQRAITRRALVAHFNAGTRLDLRASGQQIVEAEWIRLLLTERDPDGGERSAWPPAGLRIRGAHISGRLNLAGVDSAVRLELLDCTIEDGIDAAWGHLRALSLTSCQLGGPDDPRPALNAEGLRIDEALYLDGMAADSRAEEGTVLLRDANVGVGLSLAMATVSNSAGPAINGEGLEVTKRLALDEMTATGAGPGGAICLMRSTAGTMTAQQATLTNPSGPALACDGMRIEGPMFLDGVSAYGAGELGTLILTGAECRGQFAAIGAKIVNDSGGAVMADGFKGNQDVNLGGLRAHGASGQGTVSFCGATIDGPLAFAGADISNPSGPAIEMRGIQARQHILMSGLRASGDRLDSATIELSGAVVGGDLDLSHAEILNSDGVGVSADGAHLAQRLDLSELHVRAAGRGGAVRLVNAHVGGELDAHYASFTNANGPALLAEAVRVEQGLVLVGLSGESGGVATLDLEGARVGGPLLMGQARLRASSGPCLTLHSASADSFDMSGLQAHGRWPAALLSLSGMRISGAANLRPDEVRNEDPKGYVVHLDGLTYFGLPEGRDLEGWLDFFSHDAPYAGQPYQQLAASYRSAGLEQEARSVLMRQREDQLARATSSQMEQWWGTFTRWTLGYGYQPWRALIGLLATITLAVLMTVAFGTSALAQTEAAGDPGAECTVAQRALVGVDYGLPLVQTGVTDLCVVAGEATWLITAGLVLQVLGWAFATLFVAGFTSAVRKT